MVLPKERDLVQGKVLAKTSQAVFLDLGQKGTGIIYGRDYLEAKDFLRGLQIGQILCAKVVQTDNEDGYVELSVSQAQQELRWLELLELKEKDETLKVKIIGVNKGGLLSRVSGIDAFLPVSKLSPENYPKVPGGETTKILRELQKFVGKEMEVKIFDISPRQLKLILCEKSKTKTNGTLQQGDAAEDATIAK